MGPDPRPASTTSQWWTRRSVAAHIALVIWVPGCAVAAWWQVGIALAGDKLGWVYSVMWPCFALFGIVFWWFLVHDDPETLGARGLRRATEAARRAGADRAGADRAGADRAGADRNGDADERGGEHEDDAIIQAEADDPELAAYNAYLADLARKPASKGWRRR